VAESLLEARAGADKVQGRRTTMDVVAPLPLPALPRGGVRLATSWVEPAYLEPDASWCAPGGEPATPLANGGAFGAKMHSFAPAAARELADRFGRTVRVVYSREDCVRLGPKRPPIAASAVWRNGSLELVEQWIAPGAARGPAVSDAIRAFPFAERTVLLEGALAEAGVERAGLARDERDRAVMLDTMAASEPTGDARASARVRIDPTTGALERVEVRVAAGDPLDEVVLRSYCVGAAHMALGWVLTEGLAVDDATGEVHDLTIRSFGIIRAKDTPPIEVTVVDDPGAPRPRASDAVFAAVAAAAWNAVTVAEGARPERFPATETRASRRLRR
jgi:CO/xanthine dehydrogenase Mo-binding subunit